MEFDTDDYMQDKMEYLLYQVEKQKPEQRGKAPIEGIEYINLKTLKERGWTDAGIKNFDLTHDAEKPNPKYRHAGAPQKLYVVEKIEALEATSEWQSWYEASLKRREKAQEIADAKKQALVDEIKAINHNIPRLSQEELTRFAIEHYNNRAVEKGSDNRASADSENDFLNRIMVNFLRHETTNYEGVLEGNKGKTGKNLAYEALRNDILDQISSIYPYLKEEADSQKVELFYY